MRFLLASLLALTGLVQADYDPAFGTSLLYYSTATFCDEYTLKYWTCGNACKQEAGVTDVTIVSDFFEGTFGFVVYNN